MPRSQIGNTEAALRGEPDGVLALGAVLCVIIGAVAAEDAALRRPPWHTWLVSGGLVGGVVAIVVAFVWIGRLLPG